MLPFESQMSGSLLPVELQRVPGLPSNAWKPGNADCSDEAVTGVEPHASEVQLVGLMRIRCPVFAVCSAPAPGMVMSAEQAIIASSAVLPKVAAMTRATARLLPTTFFTVPSLKGGKAPLLE